MLDFRCSALLDVINAECVGAGYKVIELEELKLSLPEDLGENIESIKEHLNYLATREYINIKYLDDSEVCLTPLTKGRLVTENKIDKKLESIRDKKGCFTYAFLGALTGGCVWVLILLILFFVGVR